MGKETSISWTDYTFNPWWGCEKVSPACLHCYAEQWAKRTGHEVWGRGAPRRFFGEAHWREPRRWNEKAKGIVFAECPKCRWQGAYRDVCPTVDCLTLGSEMGRVRPRVFCASMADWLEDREDLTPHLARLLGLIHATPNLDWLLLTKRPELWGKRMSAVIELTGTTTAAAIGINWKQGHPPPNVWLGTTVENQECAERRIPELLKIPARVRFLSMEPLLGAVDLGKVRGAMCQGWTGIGGEAEPTGAAGLDWIIVGGESGGKEKRRPFEMEWLEEIERQCDAAGVALHVKQDAGGKPGQQGRIPDRLWARKEFPEGGPRMGRMGADGGEALRADNGGMGKWENGPVRNQNRNQK